MKLGQAVLDLIDGSFWESTSWSMEDIPLGFSIVSDQYGAFPQYLEVGTFMSDFTTPPPVRGLCLWADEELRCAGEVVDVVKGEGMNFSCVVLHIQGDCT